jgi:hypothetical protein
MEVFRMKRYRLDSDDCGLFMGAVEDRNGAWCRHDEAADTIAALRAEVETALELIALLEGEQARILAAIDMGDTDDRA